MKTQNSILRTLGLWSCALGVAGALQGQTALQWNPLGQWDFTNGTLTATLGGAPLRYADGPGGATAAGTVFGSTDSLGLPRINGASVHVMKFPLSDFSMGYFMPNPPAANGQGTLVNTYTIIMDVLFPTNSVGRVRPLVQTDDQIITPDADFVVDSGGGMGAPPGPYHGSIQPNTWYRIGFSVTTSGIDEYINGVKVGTQSSGGVDSRFALTPGGSAQLFQNSTFDGAAIGYVSSLQIQDVALNAGQMASLGGASASKIPTQSVAIPSYLESQNPAPNAANVTPLPHISGVLNAGGTVIDPGSISLNLEGSPLATTVVDTGSNYLLSAAVPGLLPAYSTHTASVVYSDSVAGLQTNAWRFSICKYQNINLPAPLYLETFDEVAEGGIPSGWIATNWTDTLVPGLNIFDTQSDSYKDFVTISANDYAAVYPDTTTYASPGYPTISGNRRLMIPPIVENGVLLTNLASGNLLVAESDQRDLSQVQVIFTSDYNLTGQSNVYISFHHLNEQNQDNLCSLEYSVDHGANWLPLLYMLDDGTTDNNGSDVVTNRVTGQIDVNATFNTPRPDQAHGLAYGAFIGAPITTNLIPYIRPCRNDDPIQQKRIELFRLPLADNAPAVQLRFMQAGTGSWFYDIDNLGFYSIPEPIIFQQPAPVSADFNGPAALAVQAGGDNLTYQWKLNGTDIVGATNATYTIANCATNHLGLYQVAVTNNYGGVLSDEVPLSLVFTPIILAYPQDVTISVGESVSFNVLARGGQPLSYQWLLNSNAIPGATSTNYSIANAHATNGGAYQVLVSNAFSTVLSRSAHLTVFAGPITQDMVVHLTFDGTYADSSGRSNNATSVGSPTFEPGFLGQAVHLISSGTPANNPATNNYVTLGYPSDLVFGSDMTGGVASDFSVSFWSKIKLQNDDEAIIGNKDWMSGGNPGWVIASEGGGLKWNYRDNAINQPGVGSSRRDSPTVAPQLEDGGWHHVVVTLARHSYGSIYVDGALVNQATLLPDSTNIVGSADTTGLGWSVNIGQDGTGTYTDGNSGAALDMLVDDLAIWRRVVTDQEALGIFNAGLHSNTVDQATTASPGAMPRITLQPQDAGANQGASLTLTVSALGTPALTFQWFFGNSLLAGQTNASYIITNMQPALQGGYSVVIANNYGVVTSRVASVSFTGVVLAPPTITAQPVSQYLMPGATATFSVATSSTNVTYQWYKNGVAINGATTNSLVYANVQTTNQGAYMVQLISAGLSTNSGTALLSLFTGTLSSGLVAYLPFDNDLKDRSGHGHHGAPVGSPSLAPGQIGGALHFATTNDLSVNDYVTLGYPADLQFGANDFSVGFWVNYTNQGDDPAFVANKNWNSSGNPGWGVFAQDNGKFRVQATGTSGTKMNTTATPVIRDGKWHFLLSTFWRGQYTSVYVDGKLITTSALKFGGSVDTTSTGDAINIGQDGTGTYTDGSNAVFHIEGLIDEVMLWNRVVTAPEVSSLYNAGTNGLTPLLQITNSAFAGGTYTIGWHGGVPPFTLESKTNVNGAVWTPAATTSDQSITVTPGGTLNLFRVRGNTP